MQPPGQSGRLARSFLSAILPGTGQLVGGSRRRGTILLAIAVLILVVCVLVYVTVGSGEILALLVDPSVLLTISMANLLVFGFRLYAVLDAYRGPVAAPARAAPTSIGRSSTKYSATSARRVKRSGVVVVLLLIVLIATLPHAILGYYAYASYDLVSAVFADDETDGSYDSAGLAAATDEQRMTILLLGTDAGMAREGARADAIMVASVDLKTGHIAIFGIPRETGSVAIEGPSSEALGLRFYTNFIGSLYEVGQRHPGLAAAGGDPGAVVLRDVASSILGIPIDHYMVINMDGLIDLVDALGGVTVDVTEQLYICMPPLSPTDHWHTYTLSAGVQHLSGMTALEYARTRVTDSDYARMERQRSIIAALLDQTSVVEIGFRFPVITGVIKRTITTDMTVSSLQSLLSAGPRLKTDETITIGFNPPEYTQGVNGLNFNIPNLPLIQQTVRQVLDDPRGFLSSQSSQDLDTSQP